MRVMLLPHKLAEHIPEGFVPPQKLSADVGKMVSDARDAGLLRMTGGAAPNFPTASELPLLGSNQDSPDPESHRPGKHSDNWLGFGHLPSIGARIPAVISTPARVPHLCLPGAA
jgi:hypothetical protein